MPQSSKMYEMSRSLPPRGAWIEIWAATLPATERWSLPPRGAWIEISSCTRRGSLWSSLPPRGAWIEICRGPCGSSDPGCRSPHGERGLKSRWRSAHQTTPWSLPPRGAWIEMLMAAKWSMPWVSLPPRGAWIEIWWTSPAIMPTSRRSPHGERGLKSGT